MRDLEIRRMRVDELSTMLRASRERDISERIKYLNRSCFDFHSKSYTFFVALKKTRIVGCAMLAPADRGEQWLCSRFVSVDPKHQEKGIGRRLLEEMFRFCAEGGFSLVSSSYTKQGGDRLKAINWELSERFQVPFTDPDREREEQLEKGLGRALTEEEKKSVHYRY